LAPLIPRLEEFETGAINHAMRFTACQGCKSGGILPSYSGNPGTDRASWGPVPPYGARFRLNADWYAKNKTGFSPGAQIFLDALAKYGMFLCDIGTSYEISTDTDMNLDTAAMSAMKELSKVPITAFDIVRESSFIIPHSARETGQVNPENGFNSPETYATLTLDGGRGKGKIVPIAIQPVTIGVLTGPKLAIQAGMSGYQLVWWVNGTNNQGVNWSLVSGAGTVTSAG